MGRNLFLRTSAIVAVLGALLAGCSDNPADIDAPAGSADLQVAVDLASSTVAEVTVEVDAPDLSETLTFTLSVSGGTASGTITLPVGSDRLITVRAFDEAAIETHRGATTIDVVEGTNPTVSMRLDPLTGGVPLEATIGSLRLELSGPVFQYLLVGDTVQFHAYLIDANGDTAALEPHLGLATPDVASMDDDGNVVAERQGFLTVVAVYAGMAEARNMNVTTPFYLVVNEANASTWDVIFARRWEDGAMVALSGAADAHASNATAAMQYDFAQEPRQAIQNDVGYAYYENLEHVWDVSHDALRRTAYAMQRLNENAPITLNGTDVTGRLYSTTRFAQGIALGTLAQLYDYAFIHTAHEPGLTYSAADLRPYDEVADTALVLLQEALDTAMVHGSYIVSTGEINSWMARLLATVPRTPTERAAVDWAAVKSHATDGVTFDQFTGFLYPDQGWALDHIIANDGSAGWDMRFLGQADTTGSYESWMASDLASRGPMTVASPDVRVPTVADSAGSYLWHYQADTLTTDCCLLPDSGTYNHTYYVDRRYAFTQFLAGGSSHSAMPAAETRLLLAEAEYRMGNNSAAATIINETRVNNGGLPGVTTSGVPTSAGCVPRVFTGSTGSPSSECGGLLDALKYEKRMEFYGATLGDWFFDSRGWGDLVDGTPLHFPVPAAVAAELGIEPYTYGGEGGNCSAGGTCSLPTLSSSSVVSADDLLRSEWQVESLPEPEWNEGRNR